MLQLSRQSQLPFLSEGIMEISFLNEFIDLGIMLALVGIIQMFKRADKKAEERNIFYMILFVCLCLPVGFFISMQNGDFNESIISGIGSALIRFVKYAGLGTVCYKLLAKWIDSKNV